MFVGLLRMRLHIPHARSLKDRRMVARRAVDRVRARYAVAIAEVGDTERWQVLTLGVAAVSSSAAHAREVIDKVSATITSAVAGEAMVLDREVTVESRGELEPLGEAEPLAPGATDGDEEDR